MAGGVVPARGAGGWWRLALILALVLASFGALPISQVRAATFTVTSLDDTTDGTCDAQCTLREALLAAEANADADTIGFAPTVTGELTLTSLLPTITKPLTINGPGKDTLALRGFDTYRLLTIDTLAATPITISGLTLTRGGATGGSGGAISITGGTVNLTGMAITDSVATVSGGGIYNNSGTLTLTDSTVSGNQTVSGVGNGIFSFTGATAASVTLINSTVSRNQSGVLGGGIAAYSTALTMTGSTISGNISTLDGGGIYASSSTVTVTGSTISGNTAVTGYGGGIYNVAGTVAVSASSTIKGNSASIGGGIANLLGGTVEVTDSTVGGSTQIDMNYADTKGGGLYNAAESTLEVTASTIFGNQAPSGGGIYNDEGALRTTTSSINKNLAIRGGGIYSYGGTAEVTASTINGNEVTSVGGGIINEGGTLIVTNSTISGNEAITLSASVGGLGGGVYNFGGTTVLTFVTVTRQRATFEGSGLYNPSGTMTVSSSIIVGNTRNSGSTNISDCQGIIVSQGHNVWGEATACPNNSASGDQNLATLGLGVTAVINADLADNGGPTRTHALPPGSPAIDHGDPARCATALPNGPAGKDQRGTSRPLGAGCDTGAFEAAAPASPSPSPSPSPSSTVPLTVTTGGDGAVVRNTPGTGSGPYGYAPGTEITLTAQPGTGQTFTGWVVDGVSKGWSPSLSITMDAAHTVQATFTPTKTFADTTSALAEYEAVVALATRGYILGLNAQQYGPGQGVQRAQMAALIARATPAGPDAAPTTLLPPACIVVGTWDCEVWPNDFTDRNGLDGNLWRNVGVLQHYGVTVGYTAADCARRGRAFPCFGPTDPVTYAETVTFITRAMVAKGYWTLQPNAPQPHAGVPTVFAPFVATFQFYTGAVPTPPTNWSAGATRGWFARALWAALDSYWGTDDTLPDGRNAGGFVP